MRPPPPPPPADETGTLPFLPAPAASIKFPLDRLPPFPPTFPPPFPLPLLLLPLPLPLFLLSDGERCCWREDGIIIDEGGELPCIAGDDAEELGSPPEAFGIGGSDVIIEWAGDEEEGGGWLTAAAAAAKLVTGPDMGWSDRWSDIPPGPLPPPAPSLSCFVWWGDVG